jgi:hypothetical protein
MLELAWRSGPKGARNSEMDDHVMFVESGRDEPGLYVVAVSKGTPRMAMSKSVSGFVRHLT